MNVFLKNMMLTQKSYITFGTTYQIKVAIALETD